jgi:hypothetical protein
MAKRPKRIREAFWAALGPGSVQKNWTGFWKGPGGEQPMPNARFMILVEEQDGYGLYRFAHDGEFAGDSVHRTLPPAKRYVRQGYGEVLGSWKPIPTNVSRENGMRDLVRYVLSQMNKT